MAKKSTGIKIKKSELLKQKKELEEKMRNLSQTLSSADIEDDTQKVLFSWTHDKVKYRLIYKEDDEDYSDSILAVESYDTFDHDWYYYGDWSNGDGVMFGDEIKPLITKLVSLFTSPVTINA